VVAAAAVPVAAVTRVTPRPVAGGGGSGEVGNGWKERKTGEAQLQMPLS